MLIKRFNLKDLKDLEFRLERITLLDVFKESSIYGLVNLVQIGNYNLTRSQAASMIEDYLDQGHDLYDAFAEIRDTIFPPQASEANDTEPVEHFTCLTDMYNKYSLLLTQAGISIDEFWELDTYLLYFWITNANKRKIEEFNSQLRIQYLGAKMIGAALAGGLPREAPQIKDNTFSASDMIEYNGKLYNPETYRVLQMMQAAKRAIDGKE